MCKLNANEVISSFNEIVSQANAGKQTAESVAKDLYAKAAELRAMADALTLLARQLSGNASAEPVGREVIVLKEGERHPKAPKRGRKPKAKTKTKTIPDDQLTPDACSPQQASRDLQDDTGAQEAESIGGEVCRNQNLVSYGRRNIYWYLRYGVEDYARGSAQGNRIAKYKSTSICLSKMAHTRS